jgi:hypothetical protein
LLLDFCFSLPVHVCVQYRNFFQKNDAYSNLGQNEKSLLHNVVDVTEKNMTNRKILFIDFQMTTTTTTMGLTRARRKITTPTGYPDCFWQVADLRLKRDELFFFSCLVPIHCRKDEATRYLLLTAHQHNTTKSPPARWIYSLLCVMCDNMEMEHLDNT